MAGVVCVHLDVTHHCPLWRCVGEKPESGSRERQAHQLASASRNVYVAFSALSVHGMDFSV